MWDIDFITELDLKKHIKKTIKYYGLKLESINLQKFNNNIIILNWSLFALQCCVSFRYTAK